MTGRTALNCYFVALVARVPTAILANVVGGRLSAMPVETVVDSIGTAGHGVNDTIGRNVRAGIEVGRSVIVQIDFILAGCRMVAIVVHFLVRGE